MGLFRKRSLESKSPLNFLPDARRLHVAAGPAAASLLPEICRSTAAHSVDCGLGSASEDSQLCTGRRPRTGRCGRARGNDARCTAAHPARHSCTASRLAGTPRAQLLLGSDVSVSRPSSGSALARVRASLARARRDQVRRDQVPQLGCGAASCPARSAAWKVRVRKPTAGHARLRQALRHEESLFVHGPARRARSRP